ncbi:hypothetical protein [Methanosarcina siciliae]|uniref:hypothetical protein n=1 Tax=Methanosarcina siciliae TaxID=38027 RepID=UPI000AC2EC2F|nr:hypothetical protein [Methanosarcina siciliae]
MKGIKENEAKNKILRAQNDVTKVETLYSRCFSPKNKKQRVAFNQHPLVKKEN